MNARKGLVLDANILIRAVFGQRVRQILEAYEDVAGFYSPDVCFQDAGKYIPDLSERRGFDPAVGLSVLEVKFQQRYQMRHRKSRDEDARWGFRSTISSF
jgi:hypothetical protein